jgi:DNA-binding transcriptional MocR family regulator
MECVGFDGCRFSSATAGLPRLNAFLTELTSKVHNRPIPQPTKPTQRPANISSSTSTSTPEPSRPASPHHPTPSQTAQLRRELDNQATGEVTREEVNALRGDAEGEVEEVPWRVTVGGGCQDLLFKAFGSLFNPGDSILVETPVYAGVISQFITLGVEQVEVQVDHQGVSPESLRQVMGSWPRGKPKPKAIYLVPVGSNPTGCSSTTERKLEILEICVQHGLLILEDDPYYFLAEDRRPSYFQLETRVVKEGGYVVRFDSFSKVLSSGMRLVSCARVVVVSDVGVCVRARGEGG